MFSRKSSYRLSVLTLSNTGTTLHTVFHVGLVLQKYYSFIIKTELFIVCVNNFLVMTTVQIFSMVMISKHNTLSSFIRLPHAMTVIIVAMVPFSKLDIGWILEDNLL